MASSLTPYFDKALMMYTLERVFIKPLSVAVVLRLVWTYNLNANVTGLIL